MEYITRKQQKAIHALMREIGMHVGLFSEAISSEMLKQRFANAMDYEHSFSLRRDRCSQREAKAFMDFLTSIAMDIGLDTNFPLAIYQDLEKFCVNCIRVMQCCVTGDRNNVEIHFVDIPGYNSYSQWEVGKFRRMALRKDKHAEIERIGLEKFLEKYPTCLPVKCDFHPEIKDKYVGGDKNKKES